MCTALPKTAQYDIASACIPERSYYKIEAPLVYSKHIESYDENFIYQSCLTQVLCFHTSRSSTVSYITSCLTQVRFIHHALPYSSAVLSDDKALCHAIAAGDSNWSEAKSLMMEHSLYEVSPPFVGPFVDSNWTVEISMLPHSCC